MNTTEEGNNEFVIHTSCKGRQINDFFGSAVESLTCLGHGNSSSKTNCFLQHGVIHAMMVSYYNAVYYTLGLCRFSVSTLGLTLKLKNISAASAAAVATATYRTRDVLPRSHRSAVLATERSGSAKLYFSMCCCCCRTPTLDGCT